MRRFQPLVVLVIVLIAAGQAAAQPTLVNFIADGPSNYNRETNWDLNFVPISDFNEIAVIGSGRHALVDDMPSNAGGITLNGTLEIQSGGDLTAEPSPLEPAAAGQITVNGQLIVRRGGSLTVERISTGGASGNSILLGATSGAGTAELTVSSGSLSRITRVIGPNVDFSSTGDLTIGGTLVPVITGATHSAIQVNGTATLSGVVQLEFDGHQPQFGDSWDLVTAGALKGRLTVDPDSLPGGIPRGSVFTVRHTQTTASLQLTNQLLLTADRTTGTLQIENALGGPITFDAYTIASQNGSLDGSWNSLQDQAVGEWDEADTADAFRLTEVNPLGESVLNANETIDLGTPYAPTAPTTFGERVGDLTFQYGFEGNLVDALIEYIGPENNLVLTINPETGAAAIQNESPFFDVEIDAYTITSASGALRTGNASWTSLADQAISDWDESETSDAFRLSELNPTDETPMEGGGRVLRLGTPVDISVGDGPVLDDFGVLFGLAGGTLVEGIVKFGKLPSVADADFNNDGEVNGDDFPIWHANFGAAGTPSTGDADNDGDVDGHDFLRWQLQFRTSAPGAAAHATIPEPSSWLLATLVCGLALAASRPLRHSDRQMSCLCC